MSYDIISIRTIANFIETDPLFANSSCIVRPINAKWPYYRVVHGKSHEWVYGRRITAPEKMATQIPSIMEEDGMLFVRLQIVNMRFWTL